MLVKQVNDDGESAGAGSAFRMIELGDALKRTSLYTGRFALTGVAAAALWLTVPDASALGLGRLAVQSALGETLRAEIDITSLTPEEASNMRVRVAPPESYRAAGVDYNSVLPGTQAVLLRRPDGHPYFKLTSDRPVQEPFVDVILEISWSTGRLVREYTLLFDPPTVARAPAPSTAPIATAPPPPAPAPAPAPAPSVAAAPPPAAEPGPAPAAAAAAPAPAPRTAERRPAPSKPTSAPSEVVAKPASPGVDEYRVRSGDTLSRIASQTQRSGVSLDQMLVSLFRGNPQAFIESNMNRLKAGAVLAVPSAETAKATAPSEARELIQAQSADFGAYRQKLAGAVPAAKTEAPTRQAGGKVQANVEDRKQAALNEYVTQRRWFKAEKWEDEIVSIEHGRADVYDISVEGTHRYAAAGFINHNSFWHSTIMTQKALKDHEIIDYADHHSGTMGTRPGAINPYKLGIELWRHIEDRWNKGRFGKEYDECDDLRARRAWDKKLGLGRQKIFEVRKHYNDVTFIDEFLTADFAAEQKLFVYGFNEKGNRWEILDREFQKVKRKLLQQLTNFGQPIIEVVDGNFENRGELLLAHRHDGVDLRVDYAKDTLVNLQAIWRRPVAIVTRMDGKGVLMRFDGRDHADRKVDY